MHMGACARLRLTHPCFLHVNNMEGQHMATAPIQDSDDFAFGAEAANVDAVDGYHDEDISWDADPAEILAAREIEHGLNCFDQPIN